MRLSAIVPTLNAAPQLARTLAALAHADDLIVSDGGSSDATLAIAEAYGANIVQGPRGRGVQLAAGAAAARQVWLLFVHADTELAPGWRPRLERLTARPEARTRAGAFRFALDDSAWQARVLETLVDLRTRLFALPYGDQALLIHRELYDEVGGFRPLPIMEDVDMAHRLGRNRLYAINHKALTSAARWRKRGWLRQSLRNQVCLGLYFAGVAPERIRDFYER